MEVDTLDDYIYIFDLLKWIGIYLADLEMIYYPESDMVDGYCIKYIISN